MQPLTPIFTAHLYPGLHQHLLELLRGLTAQDWWRPTVCRDWSVHDIAAHMLDTQVRVLSLARDRCDPPPPAEPLDSYAALVRYLNRLNAEWTVASRRISPSVLTEFLAITGPQVSAYVASLDPDATARFGVAWAGEETSPNWFHIGRDYTEYWHHQQQIRDAVGARPLTSREWLHPVLALFVRALPFTYRAVEAGAGQTVRVDIQGDAGGVWTLVRDDANWTLWQGEETNPSVVVSLSDDTAWRIFTKGLPREKAESNVRLEGDIELARPFLGTLAVMA